MTVRFRCGTTLELPDTQTGIPLCPTHGEELIVGVQTRAPRISGCASGPLVQTKDLGPAVRVLSAAPLPLKG